MNEQGNVVLAGLLAELDWSPRTLTRRINRLFGPGTVGETAAYHWRDEGRVPRPPLPALVAWVLTRELGRPVTATQLWQGRAADSPLTVPATADLDAEWSRPATMNVLAQWLHAGLVDRRRFLAVSGTALTTFAASWRAEPARLAAAVAGGQVDQALLTQIETSVPLLQRLDDANGGGAHMAYVGAQFRAVALLLHQGGHRTQTEQRLFAALAEIGQLAGWMAFDAGDHGLAQRYFFTALRAAREARYEAMAAHILADLAFQLATCEQPGDAITLGHAAVQAARRASPGVQASVRTRLAYGYAVAGRLDDFDTTYSDAFDLLASPGRPEPAWMYYLTPSHLETQAGYALVHAATRADPADRRTLLHRGENLLRGRAHDFPIGDPSDRRALFEGAWLAVATAYQGDLEQACMIARTAVTRATTVKSARSMDVLRLLSTRLHRAHRNEYVRDFLPQLDQALAS
ncbi:MAG TPA: hypothetical protein VHX59_02910 [Mycobacteriales bacterium]|nr:hypothetical protein [Mycobacteriales bacterium]